MAIEFDNPILGGTVLVREDIESQNFVSGTSGWEIRADGSAEFNDVVIRGGVVIGGTSLYYDGTPAPNKLIASISATDGIDEFGNGYTAGICSYDRADLTYTCLQGGAFFYGGLASGTSAPDLNFAGLIIPQGNVTSFVGTTSVAPNTTQALMQLYLGQPGKRTGDSLTPQIHLVAAGLASMADVLIGGSVAQLGMTWKNPVYSAAFAGGSTAGIFQSLQYRIDAENNLIIEGCFNALAAGSITRVFTLPATVGFTKFRPNASRRIGGIVSDNAAGTVNNTTTQLLEINNTGIVNLRSNPAWAIGDNFYIDVSIPLGDLS